MELVKIYDSKEFRKRFVELKNDATNPFKTKSELFFCLKLEDIGRLKYPIPPSKHTCHTILYITDGIHNIKIGFEEYAVKSNEIIIVPAGQIFSINSNDTNLEGIICQFHHDILMGGHRNGEIINNLDFLKNLETHYACFPEREAGFVLNLLNRLEIEYKENGYTNLDIIHPYITSVLGEIRKQNVEKTFNHTSAEVLTSKFKKLIYNQIKKYHQVSYYSAILNVTPNHLNKSVKSVTQKSATTLINEILLFEAKYLLYQTNFTINEIANQIGYNDPSYFSRIFKKHEGISPVEFRKLIDKS
jgi:AraC-like DNA-binding protein/mannose-6-phosphate isomerase-like protein (cupin superfamily)